jgi:hypothetical protein
MGGHVNGEMASSVNLKNAYLKCVLLIQADALHRPATKKLFFKSLARLHVGYFCVLKYKITLTVA